MDSISVGGLIGAVIEGYEQGVLSLADLDDQPISWGDDEAVVALIRKIARREGSATCWPTAPEPSSAAGRKWTS
jgi:aldehyde:ferredoxin oxidoreductase